MTLNQITSNKLKEMEEEVYRNLIESYAMKNGYNIPSKKLIEFFHGKGIYINIAFDLFKNDIGKKTI
jgi:hypothetical protein